MPHDVHTIADDLYDRIFNNQRIDQDPIGDDYFSNHFSDSDVEASKGIINLEGASGKFKITIEKVE